MTKGTWARGVLRREKGKLRVGREEKQKQEGGGRARQSITQGNKRETSQNREGYNMLRMGVGARA